ncbi:MAG: NADH-quinone oxidoreductase subunit C [Anaerolineales bacterium]|nr:NADH-quinone oxidoreductase subunit C [Anaerolineales bacterium]
MNKNLPENVFKVLEKLAEKTEVPKENLLNVYMKDIKDVKTALAEMVDNSEGYLSAILGIDLGEGEPIEVMYFFSIQALVVVIRILIAKEEATIPSVCDIIPGAESFERELSEMLGITITDIPNPDKLYLPEDWPADVYPLRKDFNDLEMNKENVAS